MKTTGLIIFIYAMIILIGGIMGHCQSGSTASLISGITFGALLLGSAIITFQKKQIGEYAALILTFLLDAFFTYRFILTKKFMPAGLLSVISLLMLFLLASTMKRRLNSKV